jgi:hypothetical protein
LQCPIAIAQENFDRGVVWRHNHVGLSIVIQVGDNDLTGPATAPP